MSNYEIRINRKGQTVEARLLSVCGSVAQSKVTAAAKCSPDDPFDFAVGAKLALERLAENQFSGNVPTEASVHTQGMLHCGDYALVVENIRHFKKGVVVKLLSEIDRDGDFRAVDVTCPRLKDPLGTDWQYVKAAKLQKCEQRTEYAEGACAVVIGNHNHNHFDIGTRVMIRNFWDGGSTLNYYDAYAEGTSPNSTWVVRTDDIVALPKSVNEATTATTTEQPSKKYARVIHKGKMHTNQYTLGDVVEVGELDNADYYQCARLSDGVEQWVDSSELQLLTTASVGMKLSEGDYGLIVGNSEIHHYYELGTVVRVRRAESADVLNYNCRSLDTNKAQTVHYGDIVKLLDFSVASEVAPEAGYYLAIRECTPGVWLTKGKVYTVDDDCLMAVDNGIKTRFNEGNLDGVKFANYFCKLEHREANEGEFILVRNAMANHTVGDEPEEAYSNGDVCEVFKTSEVGEYVYSKKTHSCSGCRNDPHTSFLYGREYDVIVGYKPEYKMHFDYAAYEAEAAEYYNGEVVCFESKTHEFTNGKKYTFVNGKVTDDDGTERLCATLRMTSIDQWNELCGEHYCKFVKFLG